MTCLRGVRSGDDSIRVEADDPNYCAGCTYSLLVYGAGPYGSSAVEYTLTLIFEYTLITLRGGHPTGGRVGRGDYVYYRLPVDSSNSSVSLQLTTFSGDADLYASFLEERPTVGAHDYSSVTGGASEDEVELHRYDRGYCPTQPCYLYVGVYGYRNASYSLVGTAEAEPVVRLTDGQPQRGSLSSHEWRYYRFFGGAEGF